MRRSFALLIAFTTTLILLTTGCTDPEEDGPTRIGLALGAKLRTYNGLCESLTVDVGDPSIVRAEVTPELCYLDLTALAVGTTHARVTVVQRFDPAQPASTTVRDVDIVVGEIATVDYVFARSEARSVAVQRGTAVVVRAVAKDAHGVELALDYAHTPLPTVSGTPVSLSEATSSGDYIGIALAPSALGTTTIHNAAGGHDLTLQTVEAKDVTRIERVAGVAGTWNGIPSRLFYGESVTAVPGFFVSDLPLARPKLPWRVTSEGACAVQAYAGYDPAMFDPATEHGGEPYWDEMTLSIQAVGAGVCQIRIDLPAAAQGAGISKTFAIQVERCTSCNDD